MIARALAIALGFASLTAAGAEEAAAGAEEEDRDRLPWLSGWFETGIDFETSRDTNDLELDQFLSFEVAPPNKPRLHIRGATWWFEDLDGPELESSVFRGLDDTFESTIQARLLYLYLDVADLWQDATLRLGRQRIDEGLANNRIDGLYFKQRRPKVDWYVFAGVRASIYEDSTDDRSAGAGVTWRPTRNTRFDVDTFFGEENRFSDEEVVPSLFDILGRRRFPRRVRREIDSRVVNLAWRQQIGVRHHMFGRYVFHNAESDRIDFGVSGVLKWRDIAYDISYRRRLNPIRDRANDVTGFFRILGPLDSFHEVNAAVFIPITEHYAVSFDIQARDTDRDSQATIDRDFVRLASTFSVTDLRPGLDLSASLERYNVSGGEGSCAVTGEVAKRWKKVEALFGVDFERFQDRFRQLRPEAFFLDQLITALSPNVFTGTRAFGEFYDVATVQVTENIYSVFAEAEYHIDDRQDLEFKMRYELDDGPDSPYWRFQAEYSVRF